MTLALVNSNRARNGITTRLDRFDIYDGMADYWRNIADAAIAAVGAATVDREATPEMIEAGQIAYYSTWRSAEGMERAFAAMIDERRKQALERKP